MRGALTVTWWAFVTFAWGLVGLYLLGFLMGWWQ